MWAKLLSAEETDWSAYHSTLEGHTVWIMSLAFSPDGHFWHRDHGTVQYAYGTSQQARVIVS
jgi:hypothetical protein